MEETEVVDWLVYIIVGLVSAVFAMWNSYVNSRLQKAEQQMRELTRMNTACEAQVHAVELAIATRFMDHEKDERNRDEEHAKEVAREFKELRKDVTAGHTAILQKVNDLSIVIRNGNGNKHART